MNSANTLATDDGNGSTPRVFVVEDDDSVRESLKSLIDSAGLRPEITLSFAYMAAFYLRPQHTKV